MSRKVIMSERGSWGGLLISEPVPEAETLPCGPPNLPIATSKAPMC